MDLHIHRRAKQNREIRTIAGQSPALLGAVTGRMGPRVRQFSGPSDFLKSIPRLPGIFFTNE